MTCSGRLGPVRELLTLLKLRLPEACCCSSRQPMSWETQWSGRGDAAAAEWLGFADSFVEPVPARSARLRPSATPRPRRSDRCSRTSKRATRRNRGIACSADDAHRPSPAIRRINDRREHTVSTTRRSASALLATRTSHRGRQNLPIAPWQENSSETPLTVTASRQPGARGAAAADFQSSKPFFSPARPGRGQATDRTDRCRAREP